MRISGGPTPYGRSAFRGHALLYRFRMADRSRTMALAVALALVVATAGCGSSSRSAASAPSTTVEPAQPATTTTTGSPTTTVAPTTTTSRPVLTEQARLSQAIDKFTDAHVVPFSIVAVDLATGAAAEHLADRQVLSASLYKLFVARELLRRIFDGTLSRDAPANDGGGNTVGACLRLMIVISDNRCGVAGLNIVGYGAQDAALAQAGFPGTRLASPQRTTARDVAKFFEETRNGTLLPGPKGAAAAAELYGLLNAQQVNDRLPTGLPA